MADDDHKILPHGQLIQLAPNLWQVTGSLFFPLPRNMTVYRLGDGRLVLHSVVALDQAGMAALDRLGTPAIMIVPHGFHRMDAGFYKRRYPTLKVVTPNDSRQRVEHMCRVDGGPEELPNLGITFHPVPGLRLYSEFAYQVDVEGGKALIVCDLVGNVPSGKSLGSRLMSAVTGTGGAFGVPRIFRVMMIKDKSAVKGFLARLAQIPELRVIALAHGEAVTADCASRLREAAERL